MPFTKHPHLAGDLRGALASLMVGLPYSITSGMLAFAPLGPAYLASGMAAGLAASSVAGLAASFFGGTAFQINGPRASVAVLIAGLITAIIAHASMATGGEPDVPRVLGIAMLCIGLSGVLQVAFGLLRFGAIIRFLPYPVISGFMVALGVLVLWPQIPAILGMEPGSSLASLAQDMGARWGAVAAGLVTVVVFVKTRSLYPRMPAPLFGLLAGTALHYVLRAAFGADAVGLSGLDTLAGGQMPPYPWTVPQLSVDAATLGVVWSVAPLIATIAFIGSVETLLSSSVLHIASQMRADSNKELISQGVSNMAVALVGGAGSCGAPFRGVANYAAGGRTRLSGALHSVMTIPLLLFAFPVILVLPLAALAGVLVVAGWDVVTAWRKRLASCPPADVGVGLLVMAATLVLGTVPAIVFGVMCAMFLYVRNTSRLPLRGHYDGSARLSMKVRNEEQTAFLRGLGSTIRVIEAQGSIFFGTADRFGVVVEELAAGCRHLILDMKRVQEVDPTGALVMTQTTKRLADRGVRVSIACMSPGGRRGSVLMRAGVDRSVPVERWFEDVDRALEGAEDAELARGGAAAQPGLEMALANMDICGGMPPAEAQALEGFLRREVVPAGTNLFGEGESGDRLYLLAKGEVTVSLQLKGKDGGSRRLATYGPGVILGEMAVLGGHQRSADAVALTDCVLYSLDRAGLESMRQEAPDLHNRFVLNLARQLVVRLRATTLELRVAYS
ncbi:MAG: SulP family inorganic anion transporter [Lysobacter sp.]|nr:SulP family inorganic anion transporter [Lysobacter sp.]